MTSSFSSSLGSDSESCESSQCESDDSFNPIQNEDSWNPTQNNGSQYYGTSHGEFPVLNDNGVVRGHSCSSRPKRKPYTSNIRKLRKTTPESRSKKWLQELSTLTEAKLRRMRCCKRFCFRAVDFEFFKQNSKTILSSSSSNRQTILKSFRTSHKRFFFDGRVVCVRFLKQAFHYSSDLICEISSGNVTSKRNPSILTKSSTIKGHMKKREAIISFVLRVAEDCGDRMPNKSETHLPFYQRQELFSVFQEEFKTLYPSAPPVTARYFRRIWKHHCHHVKVVKHSRFTTCDVCDEIRTLLRERIMAGHSTSTIKERREDHLNFISRERMEYQKKKDRARTHGSDFCSIIIDGADQSAFGLPHFTTTPKSQRGHAMKVKLVGLLEHRLQNRLSLATMTQEHQTGANHVIEMVHRFLNRKRSESQLPAKLFVQLDNCTRENKNRYLMGYFEMLVRNLVFESVEVGFLPIGHTHEDVDQCFSSTSARLRLHNAITLNDLHRELRCAYGGNVQVEHMKRVVNWSGLCDKTNCLRKIDRISTWRYFLFTSDKTCPSASALPTATTVSTTCHVKKNCHEEWRPLFPLKAAGESGILRHSPDLRKTPNLSIVLPEGLKKVNKRFDSEEGRINSVDKMVELHDLRDFVFQSRSDAFHWDLSECVECRRKPANTSGYFVEDHEYDADDNIAVNRPMTSNDNSTNVRVHKPFAPSAVAQASTAVTQVQEEPHSKYDYAIDSFVLIRPESRVDDDEYAENQPPSLFWVGKVVELFKDSNFNYVKKLRVHWYDDDANSSRGTDYHSFKFHPCYSSNQRVTKRSRSTRTAKPSRQELQVPWRDIVDTDTVIVSFAALSRRHTIPLSALKTLPPSP